MLEMNLVDTILGLPIFQAEWVLWLLLALSLASIAVIVERALFFRRRFVDTKVVRTKIGAYLDSGDVESAQAYLQRFDSLETNVVLFGLRAHWRGAEAVEELLEGAEAHESERYGERLNFLATLGSNAPFIGLFGTVLGVIHAFGELGNDLANTGSGLMTAISEALVATGVGLFVAIPAVIAYNWFNRTVEKRTANGALLSKTLLAHLKTEAPHVTAQNTVQHSVHTVHTVQKEVG
jgi:biopolymer transport protein ExbB/TolQ